jgi:hypothetical protein
MSDETMSMLDDRIAELEDENAALQRENASLRADKQRLDWLSTALGGYWACEHFQHRNRISRTYIDAGMADNPTPAELKEGKP